MKKLIALTGLICWLQVANSQLLLHEPFDYTPHPTNGLWTQSTAAWLRINSGDSVLVTAGSLSYTGLPASTGNKASFDGAGSDYYRIATTTAVTSGSVYYSFLLNVSSLGGLTTAGGYFTSLVQGASTTSYGASVWTRASTSTGKFNIGVSTRSNSAVSWLATDLDPGTTYFVVAAYDIVTGTANDVARIWLNTPAIGGAEPAPNATAVTGTDLSASGIDKVLLRQDNLTNTPFIEVDEIRIGTSWASVTPGGLVPSLSISAPLSAFGNVCINTTTGSNAFTVSGSNLTTANVDVAAFPGYSYSTTAGGTYTPTLSITQPGGSFTQQVFVQFTPTAVQTYNGNIVVSGGGAGTPANAATTGAGVNTAAAVTTGAASLITQVSATAAGNITATGCSAISAYGIEYSTTSGFPNGSGTQVASTNLAGGNFSAALNGLSPGITYFYKAYATNGGGTTWGTEQSFVTLTPNPSLSASTLTAFGNVCINSTAGPNSFTLSGANLTAANIVVGPLGGYTFSTTAGGTYSGTLTITQPGGTYNGTVFVQFTPTALQSYSGNIPVNGGGIAAAINVLTVGNGINTAPTVTTGSASAITQTSATAAGTINASGCSAVTAYGIEYSLTNGFPNGSGTQTASTNLSGGNFSSALTGLQPATTYYYKAYATSSGGTSYGAQQSFTTAAPLMSVTALTPFGNACVGTTAGPNSFTITGTGLSAANVTVGPLAGYSFSTSSGGTYTASLSLTQPGGAYTQQVFVRFTPTAVQSYAGNIPVGGGGANTVNVAAAGDGVNTLATVVTGGSSNINNNSATLAGSVSANGCSNVTAYGIEYSSINGFGNATGLKVPSTNLAGGSFTVNLSNLVQGATYYYKAYATNSGGTSYGLQQSFTVASIANGFSFYPSPAQRGTPVRVSMTNLTAGYYGLLFFNSSGQLVFQQHINTQVNFINQLVNLPATMAPGTYRVMLAREGEILVYKTIQVF